MSILIRNCCVVSMDPDIGNLDRADIRIEQKRIVEIGAQLPVGNETVIEGDGLIATPGFVDAHRHLWEGAMRAVTADWSILDFAGNIRAHAAQFFRPEDMYATALHGCLEALNAGVTTVADYCHNVRTRDHAYRTIAGIRASGIRAMWGYSFTGLASDAQADSDLDAAMAFARVLHEEEFADDGLVRMAICPSEPFTWHQNDQGRAQFEFARKLGARMFMHGNGVPMPDGSPPREVDRLLEIGALGSDLALVHMGYTQADEWAALGHAGCHAVFTPDTELQMGLGWPSIDEATSAGVNIALGCDITANNSADMFNQMRLALQCERARMMAAQPGRAFRTGTPVDCARALHWATMGGAEACGLEQDIGSLTPGKKADIVLLQTHDISLAGWDRTNPAATIVLQSGVHNVDTVIVDGAIVKRQGKLLADTASVIVALEATTSYIREQVDANGGFNAAEDVLYHRLGFGAAG